MLHKAFQFRLKLNNRFDIRPDINVIVVCLRRCLEAAQYRSAVGVRAVNDNNLGKEGFLLSTFTRGNQNISRLRDDGVGAASGQMVKVRKFRQK